MGFDEVDYFSAYEAGAQSRQAEVDELKQRITMLEIDVHIRDKMIDKALIQVSNHYHSCVARKNLKRLSASISEIAEIEAHESNMSVLEKILKGK